MSPTKILRPITIIPPALYVDRQADRQLNAIVEDMGRPGYVLVARQMGKTNLLLAMKRRREDQGDLVVYIDLSNRFGTPRGLFRHVIDALLESGISAPDGIALQIAAIRAADLEPNMEYDRSLRTILRADNSRRMIIILDEIDSLLNVSYSDIFLSQIRSMYFARASYDEYARLTYVLSGVVEPSSLIKDKHISPFNIGEKIYLGDFSKAEIFELAQRARLNLAGPSLDRVLEWTGGNPRMTWDVLSAIEDQVSLEGQITPALIDQAVKTLYLTDFDRAPLDHIRDLAEASAQIREGITAVRYGRPEALSSATKSKLYLAGITSGESNDSVALKNRIIDEALSDSWLEETSRAKFNSLQRAEQYYQSGNFKDAVRSFEVYDSDTTGAGLPRSSRLHLALSRMALKAWHDAIIDLKVLLADADGPDATELNYHIGRSYFETGAPEDALPYLRVASETRSEREGDAQLMLAAALLRSGAEGGLAEAETILTALLSDPAASSLDGITGFRPWAHFVLGVAQYGQKKLVEANESFKAAKDGAPPELTPALLIEESRHGDTDEVRIASAEAAAAAVMRDDLVIEATTHSIFGFDEGDLTSILADLEGLDRKQTFDRLLMHYVSRFRPTDTPLSALVHLASKGGDRGDKVVELLLSAGMDRHSGEDESDSTIFEALRLQALSPDAETKRAASNRYLSAFESRMREDLLTENDLVVFATQGIVDYQDGDFGRIERAARLIDPFRTVAKDISPNFYLIFLSIEMRWFEDTRRHSDAQRIASEVLELHTTLNDQRSEFAPMLQALQQMARNILDNSPPAAAARKIGRNTRVLVRLRDGREVKTKHKFVAADLKAGRVALIDVLE